MLAFNILMEIFILLVCEPQNIENTLRNVFVEKIDTTMKRAPTGFLRILIFFFCNFEFQMFKIFCILELIQTFLECFKIIYVLSLF